MARIQQLLFAGVAGGMVLIILGLRWALIDRYAIDLPTWDEWDAQGLHTLVPWFQHRPMLPELFAPHNEHRVVLTKLLNLGITLLNGQWDQRLECVINAFFPAALAVALLYWGRRFLRPTTTALLVLVLIAAWGLPFAWHNSIAGFHSQQFFVIGLSSLAIAWLPFTPPGSWRWWLGSTASALALLSMASGIFASAVTLAIVALLLARGMVRFRVVWPTLAVAASVLVIGVLLRHDVAYHVALKAANVQDFVTTLGRFLAWPAAGLSWLGVIIWLPWLAVAWSVLRRRPTTDPTLSDGWILFALGAWVILNVVATAFARGAGGPAPSTRYLDTLVLGNVLNLLSLGWLLSRCAQPAKAAVVSEDLVPHRRTNDRLLLIAFTFVWLGVFGIGLYRESNAALHGDLQAMRDAQRQAVARTRAYLDSGNPAYLESTDIPYPGPDSFLDRLNRPELTPLLPASVRPAVGVTPATTLHGFDRSTSNRTLPWDENANTRILFALSAPAHSPDAPLHRPAWIATTEGKDIAHGEWRLNSLPDSGHLVFALTGSPDTALEFRAAGTNQLLAEARPTREREWSMATVAIPSGPVVLRTRMRSPQERLGFTEPVFMPSLSYLAWRTAACGKLIQKIGATLLLLSVVALGCLPAQRSLLPHGVARS